MKTNEPALDRYPRQMLLPMLGLESQQKLRASRVLIVGCGALGTVAAEQLARAGIGQLRIADRDIVELTNLQRQVLFDEADAREALPKSVAASRRLHEINAQVQTEALVIDVDSLNIEALAADVQLIIDGTDNVETRYLINDVSVKTQIPWIYGGCVGVEGRVATIVPGRTACLRCIFSDPPAPGDLQTCDTSGVLGPAAAMVGALQAAAAIKMLAGKFEESSESLVIFDIWKPRFRTLAIERRLDCAACGSNRLEFLNSSLKARTTRLCGRNAVQFAATPMDRQAVKARLSRVGDVRNNEHVVRADLEEGIALTIFRDGRVIVHGTGDLARARSIYARYIGA